MINILVNKFKLHYDKYSKYWYIIGLTNFEMLELLKVNTPIQHPTYISKEELENEINDGKIYTISSVYIDPSFNPENLYKLLKK